MRIASIKIKNFRALKDLEIPLARSTVLIGENNCGKSSVLDCISLALGRRWGQRGTGLAEAAGKLHRGSLDHARFAGAVIGVFDRWLADDTTGEDGAAAFSVLREDRAAWHALAVEVGRAIGVPSDLERFLQELDLRSKEPPLGPNTVPLMTIHGAKGNEFDHVYLVGLAEDVLPGFQSKKNGDKSPQFEEERRNCFVAVTRCQKTLTLSHAGRYSGWTKAPSRFLQEMGLSR